MKYFAVSQRHFCTVSFYPTWTLTFRFLHLMQNITIHLYATWKAKAFKLALRLPRTQTHPWNPGAGRGSTGSQLQNEGPEEGTVTFGHWHWRLQNSYRDAGRLLKLKCAGKQLVLGGRPQARKQAEMDSWPQPTKKHLLVAVPKFIPRPAPHPGSHPQPWLPPHQVPGSAPGAPTGPRPAAGAPDGG